MLAEKLFIHSFGLVLLQHNLLGLLLMLSMFVLLVEVLVVQNLSILLIQ